MPLLNIKSLTIEELVAQLAQLGLKKYRAAQIFEWIKDRHVSVFDDMTNISKSERELLGKSFSLTYPPILKTEISSDGTRKFLFALEDRHTIESVLIPGEDRMTLCISSQVGCQQACRFCVTGKNGFIRDLIFYEIVDQVAEVSNVLRQEGAGKITNIVLMGMGEPLANYKEVLKAVRVITAPKGLGFSPRRITLSTAGLVPEIGELGASGVKVNLAISLNATTDTVRDEIMPVNKRYPLQMLLAACKHYPLEPRRRITFEYVLLKDVNDSPEDAVRLARLLRGIKSKVNLIPYNPSPESAFLRPDDRVVRKFQQVLLDHDYTAPIRESRGRDISAACGQLREKSL